MSDRREVHARILYYMVRPLPAHAALCKTYRPYEILSNVKSTVKKNQLRTMHVDICDHDQASHRYRLEVRTQSGRKIS